MASTGDNAPGAGAEPNPRAKLMEEVAAQMDAIETDLGNDYEIGRVLTIVEVTGPDGNVGLRVRAGHYPWISLGMLDFVRRKAWKPNLGAQWSSPGGLVRIVGIQTQPRVVAVVLTGVLGLLNGSRRQRPANVSRDAGSEARLRNA